MPVVLDRPATRTVLPDDGLFRAQASWAARLMLAVPIVVILLGTLLRCATEAPQMNAADEAGYFAWQQSWLTDRDLNCTDELLQSYAGGFERWHSSPSGERTLINKYSTGVSQAILPVTALVHGAILISNRLFCTTIAEDGFAPLNVWSAWLAVAIWSCFGVYATYRVLQTWTRDATIAAVATTCAWAGTAAFAHTWKMSLWSHGVGLSLVAITTWMCVLVTRPGTRFARSFAIAATIGLLGGLALAVRATNLLMLAPIGLFLIAALGSRGRAGWIRLAKIAIVAVPVALIPIGIELGTRWINYGSATFNGYAENGEGFFWPPPYVGKVLFHVDFGPMEGGRGVVPSHPVVVVAVLGLLMMLRTPSYALRLYAGCSLLIIAITVLMYGAWWFWDLGYSFGARWSADLYTVWAVGIAMFVVHAHAGVKRWRCVYYLLPMVTWSIVYCSGALAPADAPRPAPQYRPLPGDTARP
jgi:hypothetical protein